MRIFVINLERSVERRAHMRDQLDPLGVNYEFFAAVDGRADEHFHFPNYKDEYCLQAWRRIMAGGEVATVASHYKLWKLCVELNEPIVVLEDDAGLSSRFVEALTLVEERLKHVSFVRLSALSTPAFREERLNLPADWRLVRFLSGPMGTQCYALAPDAAARFVRHAERWLVPIDIYMDSFWKHGVPCLGLMPFPVWAREEINSTVWDKASLAVLYRHDVWAPKRFAARKFADLRRHLKNMEYALLR